MNKNISRKIRAKRGRAKISGTAECPRLCVFRSRKFIYAQMIDDTVGETLVSFSGKNLKKAKNDIATAKAVGAEIGKMAKQQKIEKAVFDKQGYKYHGKVKALAEGAREAGLKF